MARTQCLYLPLQFQSKVLLPTPCLVQFGVCFSFHFRFQVERNSIAQNFKSIRTENLHTSKSAVDNDRAVSTTSIDLRAKFSSMFQPPTEDWEMSIPVNSSVFLGQEFKTYFPIGFQAGFSPNLRKVQRKTDESRYTEGVTAQHHEDIEKGNEMLLECI